MFKKIRRSSMLTLSMLTISFGIFTAAPAYAADAPTDLSVTVSSDQNDQLKAGIICNTGSTTVKEIVISRTFTDYSIIRAVSLPAGFGPVNATDYGTYDDASRTWTGQMDGSQCIMLGFAGELTGTVGSTFDFNVSIVSSVLSDDSANVDPTPGNDTGVVTSDPIIALPYMTMNSRLLTSGPITTGSSLSYELTLKNEGVGPYVLDPGAALPMGLYFLVPAGTTVVSVIDEDLGDNLAFNGGACADGATSALVGPGIHNFYPGVIVLCQFQSNNTTLAPGNEYKFTINLEAGGDFASGTTSVWALNFGNDPLSMLINVDQMTGTNVFANVSPRVNELVFNSDELAVTVNRCPGQTATTTNGTACFRVSFSKLIFAPSFVQGDLVLSPSATIDSFTQLDDFTWEVRVSAIPVGSLFTLGMSPESVQDWSAVLNGVEVLGINTVRHEVAGTSGSNDTTGSNDKTSAQGTLANTGSSTSNLAYFSFILLTLGFLLVLKSRKREIARSNTEN